MVDRVGDYPTEVRVRAETRQTLRVPVHKMARPTGNAPASSPETVGCLAIRPRTHGVKGGTRSLNLPIHSRVFCRLNYIHHVPVSPGCPPVYSRLSVVHPSGNDPESPASEAGTLIQLS